ncbi:2-Hydroxyacid oxidase 2 isoform X1 [Callithrix jacchus]|uniref:2-Hydroxyacid oxidase 2 isoform X1 n=1 Tax=Callithrix jacchus TaxID=9483 RepID=UPI0004F02200|nr:2-Hydroxyacid oxidase 2 isoform X1 [Callithrix jacchus]
MSESGLSLSVFCVLGTEKGDEVAGPEMSLVCLTDFQALAREHLSKSTRDYIEGGADDSVTRDDNVSAFKRIRLRPRYLRDVSEVDTRTTIQGEKISAPIGIAPTGFHCLVWPDGEMSTARAAQAAGVCYITSTVASCSLEDIVTAAPTGLRWFQFYVHPDRQLSKQLVHRVESLGFKALVITVDTPVCGNRRYDVQNQLRRNLTLKDLQSPKKGNSLPYFQMASISTSFCWNDLSWLQSITRLPIILKGILTREDAELAVKHNVQGIIVSNHGGRQLDEVLASIDALIEVVAAVKGKVEVYLDGGVRTGNDVLKALALGAKCVFLGRPILWGLTCKGEHGVKEVLNILTNEFHTSMALTGCRSVAEINRHLIQFSRL